MNEHITATKISIMYRSGNITGIITVKTEGKYNQQKTQYKPMISMKVVNGNNLINQTKKYQSVQQKRDDGQCDSIASEGVSCSGSGAGE